MFCGSVVGMEQPTAKTPLAQKYPQLNAFIRTALPPLLSKYALHLLRIAAFTPLGRAVLVAVAAAALLALTVPATLLGLLVLLATGDAGAALLVGLVVSGTILALLVYGLLVLRRRWTRFKRARPR